MALRPPTTPSGSVARSFETHRAGNHDVPTSRNICTCSRGGSNPERAVLETAALPLSYGSQSSLSRRSLSRAVRETGFRSSQLLSGATPFLRSSPQVTPVRSARWSPGPRR